MNISNAKNKKDNQNKNYINKIIDINYNNDNKNTVENNKQKIILMINGISIKI